MQVIEPGSVADHRLRDEPYIWLTTVDRALQPHSSLVFFWWDGSEILVYTTPKRPKARNIELHPAVSLNLNAHDDGSGVVTIAGEAHLRHEAPTTAGYLEKYADLLDGFGFSPEAFTEEYSVEIRIIPFRARVW